MQPIPPPPPLHTSKFDEPPPPPPPLLLVKQPVRCCEGRLVSVLEGGYRIQGGIVSAFGRSVGGHVRALVDGCESRQASCIGGPAKVLKLLLLLLLSALMVLLRT